MCIHPTFVFSFNGILISLHLLPLYVSVNSFTNLQLPQTLLVPSLFLVTVWFKGIGADSHNKWQINKRKTSKLIKGCSAHDRRKAIWDSDLGIFLNNILRDWMLWCTPVTPTTQEADIGGITVWVQPGQEVSETLSQPAGLAWLCVPVVPDTCEAWVRRLQFRLGPG
jgi:hypothetical protein